VADKFGRVYVRAWGTSMVPAIRPGDLICLQRAELAEICVGEIAAFVREGRLTIHRVASKNANSPELQLVTRGDRLRRDDPPVPADELIGRVTYIERDGTRVSLSSRRGWKQQVLGPLLRASDSMTYLYLRLVSL
jgi:signal peptidase I